MFGCDLKKLELDNERRSQQLSQLEDDVIARTHGYYNLYMSIGESQTYLLVTVAAGIPTTRNQIIPNTSITFAYLEMKGCLFPAKEISEKVIWATNLLYCDPQQIDSKYPLLAPFVSTKTCQEFHTIAHSIDQELTSPSSLVSLVLYDPLLTRQLIWRDPVDKGVALEHTTAATIWLRYCSKRAETHKFITLSSLIYSLPKKLENGKYKLDFFQLIFLVQINLSGVMILDKKFPHGDFWLQNELPKNYIYINCPKTSFADVFFWVYVSNEWKLIGIQCKNAR